MEVLTPEQQKVKDNLTSFTKTLDNQGVGLNSPKDILEGKDNNFTNVVVIPPIVEDTNKDKENQQQVQGNEGQENQDDKVNENTDETVIDFTKKTLGIELKDEQGNDLTFENDFKGITDFVQKVVEIESVNKGKQYIDNVLETRPEVKALFEHILSGGDVDSFQKEYIPDFGTVTLNKDNIDQLKNMYTQSLIAKGLGDNDIKDLLEIAETKGQLLDKATLGQKELIQFRQNFLANQTKAKQESEKIEQQKWETTLKNIKDTLVTGKLLGIDIPKVEQDIFYNYITKPVKNGLTQLEIDKENKEKYTLQHELFEAYQLMKGYSGILPKQVEKVKDSMNNLVPTRKNGAVPTSSTGKIAQPNEGKFQKITASDRDKILGLN